MSRRSWRLSILLSILLCTGLASTEADDSLGLVDFKAFRLSYPAWRKVYNVGCRVVCKVKGDTEEHIAKVAD